MANMNLEITLSHSPYYDNLLVELQSVIDQKRRILREVRNASDVENMLSYHERQILKHLMKKENDILIKLIQHKGWNVEADNDASVGYQYATKDEDLGYYMPSFTNY